MPQFPEVPWPDVIGLRTVLAHHYHRVDPSQVWIIATTELPRLVEHLSDEPRSRRPRYPARRTFGVPGRQRDHRPFDDRRVFALWEANCAAETLEVVVRTLWVSPAP